MGAFKLLLAEIRYRKLNFLLSLFAVTAAATLFVAGPVLVEGYGRETDRQLGKMEDETRKLMLNIGFNLLIVNRETNMSDFWADDFAEHDMPEEYIVKLADSPALKHIRHLVATLQEKIKWRERSVLLCGYLRETPQTHFGKKKPMGYNIKPNTVWLGYELAHGFGLKAGDEIEVLGKKFTVGKTFDERGSKEDIAIAMSLKDAQATLKKPGRINHILALGCQCDQERLPTIRKELASVLPDAKITEHKSIAQARAEQRAMVAVERQRVQGTMESLLDVTTPLVLLACGVWVGLLTLSNVRERRGEIGLLRAWANAPATSPVCFSAKP